MSQTIRRKPAPARKIAARNKQARNMRNAKARTGSMLDAVMDWLPFSEDQLHKLFLVAILAAAAATVVVVARLAGIPDLMARQMSLAAADAGFEVAKVEVRGVKHLNELKIYERVQSDIGAPMTELDVDRIRAELVQLSWVADARVSRQLPDALRIEIDERTPAGLLVVEDATYLVDRDGRAFKRASLEGGEADGLVVVTGMDRAAYTRDLDAGAAAVREALVAAHRWHLNTERPPIGEVHLARAGLTLYTLEGAVAVRFGRARGEDLDARLHRFDAIWAALSDEERAVCKTIYLDSATRTDRVTVELADARPLQ